MRCWIVLVVMVLVCGCHKERLADGRTRSHRAPSSTAELDALWALAPEGATGGLVVSSRAVGMLAHGFADLRGFLHQAPELARIAGALDASLTEAVGRADPTLADFGLTPDKAAAVFFVPPDDIVMVVPLGDRDKFLAKAGGVKGDHGDTLDGGLCRFIHGRYVCAEHEQLLARIGKGSLKPRITWLGRGDIEAVGAQIPSELGPLSWETIARLSRGAIELKSSVSGLPRAKLAMLGPAAKMRIDPDHTAGFGFVTVPAFLGAVTPAAPVLPGVTLADIVRSIRGPITVTAPSGERHFDMRVPLTDPRPLQALIDHCHELLAIPKLRATSANGTCTLELPLSAEPTEVWIDGKTLRAGVRRPLSPAATGLTAAGRELAGEPWSVAFYGRGSALLSTSHMLSIPQAFADVAPPVIRAFAMIDELGAGVRAHDDTLDISVVLRTAWSNPDDVVARIEAISAEEILRGSGAATARAIAKAAPASPFAADVAAGPMGFQMPIVLLTTVAMAGNQDAPIPRRSEAEVVLQRLAQHATRAYEATGAFPAGKVPLPPTPCCRGPHGRCPARTALTPSAMWRALDFEVDGAAQFRYSYASDGKTATALAVGDLDCDGSAITYRLELSAPHGHPVSTIVPPADDAD